MKLLQVVDDCRKVLAAGRKAALRPLLRLRRLLDQSEPRYLLNQLYVDDYCVWIQRAADDTLRSLADALAAVRRPIRKIQRRSLAGNDVIGDRSQ